MNVLGKLVEEFGGTLLKPLAGTTEISGISSLKEASQGALSFYHSSKYESELISTQASVVIVQKEVEALKDRAIVQWVHPNPYWAFAKVSQLFAPLSPRQEGIHETAFVSPSATIGDGVCIGAFAYIGNDVEIGEKSIIASHVSIEDRAKVGKETELRAGVRVEFECEIGDYCLVHGNTVIGADGFGFAPASDGLAKIPQVGNVKVGNHVEIGALCSIDRAAMGSTLIGDGTKLDSKVHVGHNVELGKNNILCGLVGVAGSSTTGDWVVLGGNACVSDHMTIGPNIRVGAKSGVTHPISEPGDYMGFPAIPAKNWRRMVAASRRLASLEKRIRELEAGK